MDLFIGGAYIRWHIGIDRFSKDMGFKGQTKFGHHSVMSCCHFVRGVEVCYNEMSCNDRYRSENARFSEYAF